MKNEIKNKEKEFELDYWLFLDETKEAVFALEMVSRQLTIIKKAPYYWKWAILALHSALQGFFVLSLSGTNELNTLTEKSAKEWLESYEKKDGKPANRKLENFLGLFERIQSERMEMYGNSKKCVASEEQKKSVKKLNQIRNQFSHYVPLSWAFNVRGLPTIFENCIGIIEFLAFDCGNIHWYENPLENKTRKIIGKLRKQINDLKSTYSRQ